jgi:hypothetical protein
MRTTVAETVTATPRKRNNLRSMVLL